ncbi:MAG: hypothetical protein QM722_05045 [Piscinibacter sp.]
MTLTHKSPSSVARRLLATVALALAAGAASATGAADAARGIEQVLAAAAQDKRGVTLYVAGQAVSGAVVRIEPGLWVELRSQQFGRIVVRLDRVDGIAAP